MMDIEYEAVFFPVVKEDIRERLKKAGAVLIYPEYLQKRIAFHLPLGHEIKGGWARVRQEADNITLSVKVVDGHGIENKREVFLVVDNFDNAELLLTSLGCRKKAYQENKGELLKMDNVEVTIDEWPYLDPFVEIEGLNEKDVGEAAKKLGFIWKEAIFHSVDYMYYK